MRDRLNYFLNMYLRLSGNEILLKSCMSLSTETKGPRKQVGGGIRVQRWAAAAGNGNVPPDGHLLIIIICY